MLLVGKANNLDQPGNMANPFVALVARAAAENWCLTLWCTTCYCANFRAALAELGGRRGTGLCEALCQLSPPELIQLSNWVGALVIAVRVALRDASQIDAALRAWLPHVGSTPQFDDVVLYFIVRNMPSGTPTREAWIEAAVPIALANRNFSLIETLLIVLGREANRFPELVQAATDLATDSEQMRRVLRNKVGVALA